MKPIGCSSTRSHSWARRYVVPLLQVGVPDGASQELRRQFLISNAIIWLAIVVTVPTIPFFFGVNHPAATIAAYSSSTAVLFYGAALAIVASGHRRAALLLFSVAVMANVMADTFLLGTSCGTQYYFIAIASGSMLAWPRSEAGWRLVVAGGGLVLFLLSLGFAPEGPILGPDLPANFVWSIFLAQSAGAYLVAFACVFQAVTTTESTEIALEFERKRSERLLLNILPASVADRLKGSQVRIADSFEEVSVLFADIVGFTSIAERLPPGALVEFLDSLFSEFDRLATKHGLEKIKTIGDAYMVAGGVPETMPDHAAAVARMALDMLESSGRFLAMPETTAQLRIGMATGPVTAGVIGSSKFIYDLWGDTVNTASRMESHGTPGSIQVTRRVRDLLRGEFCFESRGVLEIKGKGAMEVFELTGVKSSR